MSAVLAGYDDAVSAQLSEAEAELVFLDDKFAAFLAATEDGLFSWDWYGSGGARSETVDAARDTIAKSIAQLHAYFMQAAGGAPINWEAWWALAKDVEQLMGATSRYNNTYGTVGGKLDVIAGEGKKKLEEATNAIAKALPSEGKLWLGVGIVVLVLFLILAIKLS